MQIIVNAQLPPTATQRLQQQGTIVPFLAPAVPWLPLRGHADLFITHIPTATPQWVVAPNLPADCRAAFEATGIACHIGNTPAALDIASCGAYNVACSDTVAVGNRRQSDPVVLSLLQHHLFVDVRQGMARCSTLFVGSHAAITSDRGICSALRHHGIDVLWVSQQPILLPGYSCGCLGGCAGLWHNTLFFIGALQYHPQGYAIRSFLLHHHKTYEELYPGPLYDAGSLFFL